MCTTVPLVERGILSLGSLIFMVPFRLELESNRLSLQWSQLCIGRLPKVRDAVFVQFSERCEYGENFICDVAVPILLLDLGIGYGSLDIRLEFVMISTVPCVDSLDFDDLHIRSFWCEAYLPIRKIP